MSSWFLRAGFPGKFGFHARDDRRRHEGRDVAAHFADLAHQSGGDRAYRGTCRQEDGLHRPAPWAGSCRPSAFRSRNRWNPSGRGSATSRFPAVQATPPDHRRSRRKAPRPPPWPAGRRSRSASPAVPRTETAAFCPDGCRSPAPAGRRAAPPGAPHRGGRWSRGRKTRHRARFGAFSRSIPRPRLPQGHHGPIENSCVFL